MEELNTTVEQQDTIPADETHADENGQSTESGTPQPEAATEDTQDSEKNATDGADGGKWSLPVVFNHEAKSLTKDEAIKYAQMGMKYSDGFDYSRAQRLYNQIDYLAALQDTTPDELINNLTSAQEASYRAELSERFGSEDNAIIEDMMALYRSKQKDKYEKVIADRKAAAEKAEQDKEAGLNTRLAEEFTAMKADFPELTDFAALPEDVRRAAAEGTSLEHAYLKHLRREAVKTEEAKQSAQHAAKSSAGSLTGEADTRTDDEKRYLSALWGR